MHKFRSMISLGNGIYSMADCYQLHKILDETLTKLGGFQQQLFSDKDELNFIMWEVKDHVRNIAMALTGCEIEFINEKGDENEKDN